MERSRAHSRASSGGGDRGSHHFNQSPLDAVHVQIQGINEKHT